MGDIYDWELDQKTASAISVGAIPEDMLTGYRTKPQGQGEPRRHAIVGEPFETRNPYHKDGTIAFADVFEQPDHVNIGYVSTAPEHRGQGHASALMKHVYDSYPDKKIHWGQRMDDAAEHMYQQYRQTMPDRTARTAAPDLATNWVYFRHKDWDDPRLVSGAQPHHVLVHKVHDGELDGEEILGQLSNTWARTLGTPKGLEHDVARGVYDKKGRPQIWESNCDRNLVYDKALSKYEYAAPRAPVGKTAHIRPATDFDTIFTHMGDVVNKDQEYPNQQAVNSYDIEGQLKGTVVFEELNDGTTIWVPSIFARTTEAAMELFSYMRKTFPGKQLEGEFVNSELGKVADRYNRSQGFTPWTVERREEQSMLEQENSNSAWDDQYITASSHVPMPKLEDDGGHAYEKMVCSHCYSDDLRNGKCYDCGSDEQNNTYMVYDEGNPVGFNNMDGTMTPYTPRPREARVSARTYNKTWEQMYADIQSQGWNVESQGPKGDRYAVTITNPQGSRVVREGNTQEQALAAALTWVWQHSHMSMAADLPITPRTTLGQVFSRLRPNEADGNHLGMQAHALRYTSDELATFLELQEADGTPRGWKTFKDAAITAYASRGWKVEAALTLEVYPLEGDLIRSQVQEQDVPALKKQYSQEVMNREIHRARLVDQMTGRTSWDTDEDWGTNTDWVPQRGNNWQQGQVIPVEQDWAFTRASSDKPDFTFVYYQGTLEVEDWSANSRPADMLKRILDLGGKDITDNNVEDNNMASGDVYKRDGEIDVELTNLADEDVQTKALDSVHEWAKGMNLIGPIQPHNG